MPERDIKGERGGDTGKTKQVGKGQRAEKGDTRREIRRIVGRRGQVDPAVADPAAKAIQKKTIRAR